MSLSINRVLRISLKNDTPLEVTGQNSQGLHFSRFSDHASALEIFWHLISNKSGKDFLIGKLKKIDYLFQVYSPENVFDITAISASLRVIDTITAVFLLDIAEIKDKNIQYLIP